MPNILSQWLSRVEYNLYYHKYLQQAEKYSKPYVIVYDIFHMAETDYTYMWKEVWLSRKNCSSLCVENLYEWVLCDESDAINLLLTESEYIIDHYPFTKYIELVKTYCNFKEEQARRLILDTKKMFPSCRALQL